MVTTSNTVVAPSPTTASNMLLYNNNTSSSEISNDAEGARNGITTCNNAATLEQYRLQLYNYALNMERFRGPPYTATAMAAAAAYASTTTVSTTALNGPPVHSANYKGTVEGPPTSYLCATTAGNLIAATTHMVRTPAAFAQNPSTSRLALASMSLFPQRIFQPEEPKPQHSYIGLIAMAILSSAETKLVLSDIYQYILDNYPYFRTRGPGWRNSIRHNLSLNDCFIKSGRSANGKGHYWAIHPANMEDFRKGDFRRRKAQRKVRKHMGLAVDDNGTDSPSPPPAMDLRSPSYPSFQHIVMGTSTITAAQQLAAQSFGWRFTQQHHRQQPQYHAISETATSYMGQIFTYRPQHFPAGSAAAALCHSDNTHQHEQQAIGPTSLQQHNSADTSIMQPTNLLFTQPCINASNMQANVFNGLISKKRKRQFDVASLLAPDYSSKRELQQQYIRKHTCNSEMDEMRPSSPFNNEFISTNITPNEVDVGDIDVVDASDDEDLENGYDNHDDDEVISNSNSQCHSNSQSNNDDDEADCTQHRLNLKSSYCKISEINSTADKTMLKVHDFEPDDNGEEEGNEPEVDDEPEDTNDESDTDFSNATHNNNNNAEETHFKSDDKITYHLYKATCSPLRTHLSKPRTPSPAAPHLLPSNQLLIHANDVQYSNAHSQRHLPINADTHNLFGRYYGTYMVAATAARINSSMPSVNTVANTD